MKRLFKTYLLLLALLALTIVVSFLPLGAFIPVLNFSIAGLKALLVAGVFMDLIGSRPLVRIFALSGLYWLSLLMALTLTDYVTRPGPTLEGSPLVAPPAPIPYEGGP